MVRLVGLNRLAEGGIAAGLAWSLALGSIAGAAAAAILIEPSVGLTALLCIVVPAPIVIRIAQGRWDPFEPIQILAAGFIVFFVVRPVAEQVSEIDTFFNLPLGEEGFVGAAAICLVGILCLYAGYALNVGPLAARKIKPLPMHWDTERSIRFGVGILVVAALGTALFALSVGPGALLRFYLGRTQTDYQTFLSISGYVGLAPYLTIPATFIFLFAFLKKRTPGVGLLLFGSLLAALYLTVPRGDRTYILALVMPLLVLWFLRRGRRPSGMQILGALLVAVISLNVLLELRRVETRDQRGIGTTIVNALTNPFGELKQFAVGVDLGEFSVLELEYEAITSARNPLELHPGATIASLIVGPLPRKLVGEKPKSGVEHVAGFLFRNNQRRASFGPSMFGDMFADYGWVTVIAFSFLLGVVVRTFWEYFRLYSGNEGIQIVLASILPLLIIMTRNNIPDITARSLQLAVPLILCMIVCSRPRTRRVAGYRTPVSSSGATPARSASR